MEFFPSTGRSQWPIITESIDAADFCIFAIAGRYDTISDTGTSWTHREFREAVATKMPIIGMLHNNPGALPQQDSESNEEGRAGLASIPIS